MCRKLRVVGSAATTVSLRSLTRTTDGEPPDVDLLVPDPELWARLDYLRPGDVLVLVELSRLVRSLDDLLALVGGLRKRGIGFPRVGGDVDFRSPGRRRRRPRGGVRPWSRAAERHVGGRSAMVRDDVRERLVEFLIEKVREDAYPSTTHLDLIEQSIPRHMIPEYLAVLMDKVEQDRFPSIPMLHRVRRVLECLPGHERYHDREGREE